MLEQRKSVRRLLWRWGRVIEFCTSRQREIDGFQELMAAAGDLHPAPASGMPGGNGPGRPTEKTALRVLDLTEKYRRTIDSIHQVMADELDFKEAMDEAVASLSAVQQRVLELRYLHGYRWDFIAFKMCSSEQTARRTETAAVDILLEKIKVERF